LVTGATGGIGSKLIQILLLDSDIEHIYALVKKVDEHTLSNNKKITFYSTDLTSYSEITALKEKIMQEVSCIDWIVSAHGHIDIETDLEKQTQASILKTFEVNILSIIYMTQVFLKHIKSGGGMIHISSTAGIHANGKYATYSATKAALNNFTQAIARNQKNISSIAVCPGPTNTKMRQKIAGDATEHQDPLVITEIVLKIIHGKSKYVSGDIIVVRNNKESLASGINPLQ